MASNRNTGNLARWPIVLSPSFKFIGGYLVVQPPYQRLQYCSVYLFFLIWSESILTKSKVCMLIFSNTGIHIEWDSTFPSLYHISCMRDSFFSSSCAAYNADWYAQLGALPTFCNVSCPVYLETKHTYRVVPPEIICWSATLHRLSIPSVSLFIPNLLFWIKSAGGYL